MSTTMKAELQSLHTHLETISKKADSAIATATQAAADSSNSLALANNLGEKIDRLDTNNDIQTKSIIETESIALGGSLIFKGLQAKVNESISELRSEVEQLLAIIVAPKDLLHPNSVFRLGHNQNSPIIVEFNDLSAARRIGPLCKSLLRSDKYGSVFIQQKRSQLMNQLHSRMTTCFLHLKKSNPDIKRLHNALFIPKLNRKINLVEFRRPEIVIGNDTIH
jgi:hypothetical protein